MGWPSGPEIELLWRSPGAKPEGMRRPYVPPAILETRSAPPPIDAGVLFEHTAAAMHPGVRRAELGELARRLGDVCGDPDCACAPPRS